MKKGFLTVLLSMVCFLIQAQTVEMSYSFGQPNITTIQDYEQIQLRGCMQSALAGQPSLPWQSVSLLLPQGQEAESIEVILSDFRELDGNHELFPYQPSRTTNDITPRALVKDESLYASKTVYPVQNHGVVTTQYKNGFAFAFSAFTPVQYIPASGRVMYAQKATVRVHTKAAKADHSAMLWATPEVKNSVKRLAQNPEMIESYNIKGREVNVYDILIITSPDFINNYDTYRAYYNSIGLRNRIVSTSEIYASMTGTDNPDKIRNYIIQEYQTNGILMVVLGGDIDLVPYRGLYCYVTSGGGNQESNNIPADLYYCGLDGTWNDNGNNRYGEPGEDDLLPEIGMSRMSFQTETDLANMINKTLSYQQYPVLGEFHKVILAGEHLYDDPNSNGSDYLELLIGTHDDNGYTTTCYPVDYDFTKLYEEQGNWSGSLLRNAINAGTSYVHHDGHANTGFVAGWYGIDNNDFTGANGTSHNFTFFHTQGCDCGAFDENCILERMVKIANFAVAVIGNSRYGWFNEGQTEGPGCHLEREMTDAQWNDRIGLLGCAISESKCMTAPWVTAPGQWEEGALRWNFYDMNVLGDGAVNVWLDEPFTPNIDCPSQIVVGSSSFEVTITDDNGVPQQNYRCLIYMEDEVIAMGLTDENGIAEMSFEGGLQNVGAMTMKVTGVNAWPQTVELLAVPSNTPYVVYENYSLSNGAEQIDFGGSYAFDLTLKNVGNVNASNVIATLFTDNEYVTINEATATVGNLNGNQIITLENAFAFSVSDDVPNNTLIRFNLTCTDGTDTWESHFNVRAYAPEFEMVTIAMEAETGSYLNPGDGGTIHFTFKNIGGSTAPSVRFDVYNSHPEVSISPNQWMFDEMAPEQEYTVDMSFTLGDDATTGAMYELPYAVQHGHYVLLDSYYIPVGQSMEGFETGDFSAFDWHSGSIISAWEVVRENAYEGNYCAKSSAIGDYESSTLYIDLDVAIPGDIYFFLKVSSESGYDKLHFLIDNQDKGNWSGEIDWNQVGYPLTPGTHRVEWTYSKDVSFSSGSDCAWIDNVIIPAATIITEVGEVTVKSMTLYPNPNNGSFYLNLPNEDCDITVFNNLGQMMHHSHGNGLTTINLNDLSKGVYFVTVTSATQTSTQKFIKE